MSYITVKESSTGYLVIHIDGHMNEVPVANFPEKAIAESYGRGIASERHELFRLQPGNESELKSLIREKINQKKEENINGK